MQSSGGLRLALEPFDRVRSARDREGQDLEGDFAAHRSLLRFVDHAHAAASELGDDFEVTDLPRRALGETVGSGSAGRGGKRQAQELERFEPFAQLVGEVLVAPKQLLDGLTTAVLSLGVPLAEDLSHALLITHVVPRALS